MIAIFLKILRYWNTIKYLKRIQILGRLKFSFKSLRIDSPTRTYRNEVIGKWVRTADHQPSMVGENTFSVLGETHEICGPMDWNNKSWDKLWLFNIHYFNDLNALISEDRVSWHRGLIRRWVDENPPVVGIGWEAYPTAIRIVNWIKWSLAGNELEEDWELSLFLQSRHLFKNLETHLLGNHLFADAKALVFSGLFFGGSEAKEWYRIGLDTVQDELNEQILADGGNFERSTMYHAIFLEDLVDLVNVHCAYAREIPNRILPEIGAMYRWLEGMCHPDGEISFFNDAALGVASTFEELKEYGARFSGKILSPHLVDWESAVKATADDPMNLLDLRASGYTRVAAGEAVALIDRAAVGPDYLPAHAHADTLSFELSLYGHRAIVNSGTSTYEAGEDRQRQRSTCAHSTVVIDGEDSSEVWSAFRTARRARVSGCRSFRSDGGEIVLIGSHDGYARLHGKPIHQRTWIFSLNSLVVRDCITGDGEHSIEVIYPLHPEVEVVSLGRETAILSLHERRIQFDFTVGTLSGAVGDLSLENSYFHPRFGVSISSHKLLYRLMGRLPVEANTRIAW